MSIASLLIGKKNSTGVPGKNVRLVNGVRSAEYAYRASEYSKLIQYRFVSTDCGRIQCMGREHGWSIIDRPSELAQPETLTEDVLSHALEFMDNELPEPPEIIVLHFCNTPAIDPVLIDEGIQTLLNEPEWSSVFSLCKFDMFSPVRAQKVVDGEVVPFVDPKHLPEANSLRNSQGACYFLDFSVQVLRRECFESMGRTDTIFKWMGKKPKALIRDARVFDVDEEWQLGVVEEWVKNHAESSNTGSYS